MNHQSSRSHTIVRMKILVHEPNSVTRESIISFVDLAGSEKIDKHKKMPISSTLQNQKEQEKTRAMHTRIQEGKQINKSLFYLTQVIAAKAAGSK